jgi:hypothetical protein
MKTSILPILVLLGLLAGGCSRPGQADVGFARTTFEALARGEEKVAADIDWKILQSMGIDVGASYVVLATEDARARFREGFITQFSSAFLNSGGKPESFSNWRVATADGTSTVVHADGPNGTLVLTVTQRDGARRLSAIQQSRR